MCLYCKWLFAPWGGDFALPWTMLAFQQLQTFAVLQLWFCLSDQTHWGWGQGLRLEDWLQLCLLTFLFCLNVGLNALSLVRLSITLNQTVRACMPIGVLVFGACLERRVYPRWSYLTAAVLVAGIALSCWSSPDFEAQGFALAVASFFAAALGSSFNGRILHVGPFGSQGTSHIATQVARLTMMQAIPATMMLLPVAALAEGAQLQELAWRGGPWSLHELLGLLVFSGVLSLATNLCRCSIVAAAGALSETVTGNSKVAALCVIDHFLFGTTLQAHNYVGVVLTFAGFSVHSWLQSLGNPGYNAPVSREDSEVLDYREEGLGLAQAARDEHARVMWPPASLAAPRTFSIVDTGSFAELVIWQRRGLQDALEAGRPRALSMDSGLLDWGDFSRQVSIDDTGSFAELMAWQRRGLLLALEAGRPRVCASSPPEDTAPLLHEPSSRSLSCNSSEQLKEQCIPEHSLGALIDVADEEGPLIDVEDGEAIAG